MLRHDLAEPRPSLRPPHFYPRPKPTPRGDVPPGFWITLWCLGCLSLGLVSWSVYRARLAPTEKSLQAALLPYKVNSTSVEEPELLPPPSPEQIDLVVHEIETSEPPTLPPEQPAPQSTGTAPPTEEPPQIEPPVIEVPKVEPPAVEMPPFEMPPTEMPPVEMPKAEPQKEEPPQVEIPKIEIPKIEVPMPPPAPVPPEEPPVEIPSVPAPAEPELLPAPALEIEATVELTPLVYLDIPIGETPMLSNWKSIALCGILSAASFVSAPPVVAGDPDKVVERLDKMEKSINKSFKAVQADMESLKDELKKLKEEDLFAQTLKMSSATMKLTQIEKDVAKLQTEFDSLRKRIPVEFPSNDKAGLDDIKSRLIAIEQALGRLVPGEKRVALSPPTQVGRVLLVNLYAEELLFVVNQKPYRVGPNSTVALDGVPAGILNYEVLSGTWGQRARSTTSLAVNETFTLTAR